MSPNFHSGGAGSHQTPLSCSSCHSFLLILNKTRLAQRNKYIQSSSIFPFLLLGTCLLGPGYCWLLLDRYTRQKVEIGQPGQSGSRRNVVAEKRVIIKGKTLGTAAIRNQSSPTLQRFSTRTRAKMSFFHVCHNGKKKCKRARQAYRAH